MMSKQIAENIVSALKMPGMALPPSIFYMEAHGMQKLSTYLLEYTIFCLIPKWSPPTEQNVGYNSYAPNIRLRTRSSF